MDAITPVRGCCQRKQLTAPCKGRPVDTAAPSCSVAELQVQLPEGNLFNSLGKTSKPMSRIRCKPKLPVTTHIPASIQQRKAARCRGWCLSPLQSSTTVDLCQSFLGETKQRICLKYQALIYCMMDINLGEQRIALPASGV
eukprot:2013630-Amphidinium_carterae.1